MDPIKDGSPGGDSGSQGGKPSFSDVTRLIQDNIGASARLLQAAQSLHAEATAEREKAQRELARLRAERANLVEHVRSFHEVLGLLMERLESDSAAPTVQETHAGPAVPNSVSADVVRAFEAIKATEDATHGLAGTSTEVLTTDEAGADEDGGTGDQDQAPSPIPLATVRSLASSDAAIPYLLTIRGPRRAEDVLALDEILERHIGADKIQPLEFIPGTYRVAVSVEDPQALLEQLVSQARLPLHIVTVEPGRMDAVMTPEGVSA